MCIKPLQLYFKNIDYAIGIWILKIKMCEMHQNAHFQQKNSKNFLRRAQPPPHWEGTPLSRPHLWRVYCQYCMGLICYCYCLPYLLLLSALVMDRVIDLFWILESSAYFWNGWKESFLVLKPLLLTDRLACCWNVDDCCLLKLCDDNDSQL